MPIMRIEKTIEAVNGWEKREAPLPPVETVKAEEIPVVQKTAPAGGNPAAQPEKAK